MILWKLLVLLNVLKKILELMLIESSLVSWILSLESWSWFLILETWFLNLWNLLNSWFFGIIKITLEGIASTISPFLMMANLKSRECIQVLFYRSLIPFSPFLFEFMLNFKVLKKNIISWFLKIPIFLSPFGNIKKVKVRKTYII